MTTPLPMFPHTVDSTIMSAFRSCPQKAFRTYVEHWKPKSESVHLVAGGAFAKGVEVARKSFYDGEHPIWVPHPEHEGKWKVDHWAKSASAGNRQDAAIHGIEAIMRTYGDFDCPPDSAKSCNRMMGALEFYLDAYPLGEDGLEPLVFPNGQKAIEFSFAIPLNINHPVTGDPILYTGRCDLVGKFAGGIYPTDEKTTSSLGQSWSRQWEMRGQFTGYCWAVRELLGLQPAGALVRGVSILKTKYDTQQVITNRSNYEIDRWLDQTHRDLRRMIAMWREGHWDYAIDGACAEYGGCSLTTVCKSSSPESWLPMYFEKRVWDPLARKELSVEEWEASWGHGK